MADYRLTYFDIDGGRGEPVRIAFHAAGVDFEDDRISFPEFMERRKDMRFTCAPVLYIDGVAVTQSNSMCRYVGKLAGLYPEDALQALYCDEAMGAVEDLLHQIVPTFGLGKKNDLAVGVTYNSFENPSNVAALYFEDDLVIDSDYVTNFVDPATGELIQAGDGLGLGEDVSLHQQGDTRPKL